MGNGHKSRFQSPSGVLGVCRSFGKTKGIPVSDVQFQSPSGVLGVCREVCNASVTVPPLDVSVPFRGFRGLQG